MTNSVAYLRSARAIRERCGLIFEAALEGRLEHFSLDLARLDATAQRVVDVTRAAYPDLAIPYHSRWNHFRAGDVDRVGPLRLDGPAMYDLVVTSVLLDAGAGPLWSYGELATSQTFGRSEGLAVASFHMFDAGAFSSDPAAPHRADAAALASIDAATVGRYLQVSDNNPLVGLEGRARLLRELGAAVIAAPHIFAGSTPRVGDLLKYLRGRATGDRLPATAILDAVLEAFSPIWPGRVELDGHNLGDVWRHPVAGLVPFHKLSQWLTYSLIEPLESAGVTVVDTDELTGLPEYRNGGLLIDMGVLVPKHDSVTATAHTPDSTIVVEWRALTVTLLDRVADRVRAILGVDRAAMPLAKVLEGGTWSAGRQLAAERRGGLPPIRIDSDGTVF